MTAKIGIARALYSYYHFPLFKTFFEALGCEVLISPKTNQAILQTGIQNSPPEICLPVKAFIGHIAYLIDKVDYIFIPRITSIKDAHTIRFGCPKAIASPDLIRATFKDLPPILELNWDERITDIKTEFTKIAKVLKQNGVKTGLALRQAQRNQLIVDQLLTQGLTPDWLFDRKFENSQPIWDAEEFRLGWQNDLVEVPLKQESSKSEITIGVIGHPYLLFDETLSLGIIEKLRNMGVFVITSSALGKIPVQINHSLLQNGKELSWIYEQEILGSVVYLLSKRKVSGLLLISSFACGTSAVVQEIIQREIARLTSVPILCLLFDEHTAETGIMTRLESFIDLLQLTKKR